MITRESDLSELNLLAELAGGNDKIRARHAAGRMTARERIDLLFDPGSFIELEKFKTTPGSRSGAQSDGVLGDGVVVGYGLVDGRQVFAFADEHTVHRGTVSQVHAQKVCRILDLAMSTGAPVVGLVDSEGPRLEDGILTLAGNSEVAVRAMKASGVTPMIACVMGPAVASATYFVALSDIVVMVDGSSHLTLTSPEITALVTREDPGAERLGGARVHAERTGIAHRVASNDQEALGAVREVLRFLPANNAEDPPRAPISDDPGRRSSKIRDLIPTDLSKPYDVRSVLQEVVDDGILVELGDRFAPNMMVAFARMAGRAIGIVANQPNHLAGTLDAKALRKASRFVRTCDCFNLPVVTFVDVPGFFPGVEQEHRGIVRAAAKLLFAYAEATVPKITLVTRKGYGAAYVAMGTKQLRGDVTFAFPTAEIAVMDPHSVVHMVHAEEIDAADDKSARHAELTADYRREVAHSYAAAQQGYVDEVIPPDIARPRIIRALEMMHNKRHATPPRKHGNIPL
ncbi:MAG: acyl-CoA carboxylase subunit beta [Myxococcota bacterium]